MKLCVRTFNARREVCTQSSLWGASSLTKLSRRSRWPSSMQHLYFYCRQLCTRAPRWAVISLCLLAIFSSILSVRAGLRVCECSRWQLTEPQRWSHQSHSKQVKRVKDWANVDKGLQYNTKYGLLVWLSIIWMDEYHFSMDDCAERAWSLWILNFWMQLLRWFKKDFNLK